MTAKPPARVVRVIDLAGNAEIRRLAGRMLNGSTKPITRHRLIRLRAKDGFPAPIKRLDQGEVFDRREVRAWLDAYRSL